MSTIPPTYHKERQLLLRMSEGEERAFEEFYAIYQPKLFRFIYPFTNQSKSETDEILQDIFLKIWVKKEGLAGVEYIDAYIFQMAKNRIYDLHRRKMLRAEKTGEYIVMHEDNYDPIKDKIQFDEFEALAKKAIEKLSKQKRRIFEMKIQLDLSLDEIASELNISKFAVKKQLGEARKSVREFMLKNGDLGNRFHMVFLMLVS